MAKCAALDIIMNVHGSASSPPDRRAKLEFSYQAFRRQIEHEDLLVGSRVGWLIAGETLLAAGYVTGPHGGAAGHASLGLPIAGMALAALVGCSIYAALWSIAKLRAEYAPPEGADLLRVPDLVGSGRTHGLGVLTPLALPPFTVVAWVWALLGTAWGGASLVLLGVPFALWRRRLKPRDRVAVEEASVAGRARRRSRGR